jgi:hypothetical protein
MQHYDLKWMFLPIKNGDRWGEIQFVNWNLGVDFHLLPKLATCPYEFWHKIALELQWIFLPKNTMIYGECVVTYRLSPAVEVDARHATNKVGYIMGVSWVYDIYNDSYFLMKEKKAPSNENCW